MNSINTKKNKNDIVLLNINLVMAIIAKYLAYCAAQ